MNRKLEKLLETVRSAGGDGQCFDVEWGELLPTKSKAVAIFFLNSNRLYVAASSKAGLVVGVVINRTNKIGGLVDIYAHYCFPEPDRHILERIEAFFSRLDASLDVFDIEEETRYNKKDEVFYNIAYELGYVI